MSPTSLGGQTLVICWQVSLLSLSNQISFGPTLQIKVGGKSPRPLCLQSLVSRGAGIVDQPQRASSHSSGLVALQPFSGGKDSRGIFQEYHSSGLHLQAGGHIVTCPESGSSTPSAFGQSR